MQKDFITVTPDSGNGDATVTVVASENIGNERSLSLNVAGGSMTRTISVNQFAGGYSPIDAPNGVYIVHANGRIYPRANWNTSENANAVGVGVKTSNCSFVIAPEERNAIQWGGYGTLINGCTTTTNDVVATKDYAGVANTNAIIAQLGTSVDIVAGYCRNYTFKNGKKGYLPALGELYEAYENKAEIDACMSLIGGYPLYDRSVNNYWKWSSAQYNNYTAWVLDWINGKVINSPKDYIDTNVCARPFAALV